MAGNKISDINPNRKPIDPVFVAPKPLPEIKEEPVLKQKPRAAVKPAMAPKNLAPKQATVKPESKPQKPPRAPMSSRTKKMILWPTSIMVSLAVLAGASYVLVKPKAEVNIWPKKTPVSFETQILVSASQSQAAFIPGEVKSQESTIFQQFPTTGVEDQATKATGKITVYNAYALSSQTLIANTRFVSDNGKLFRTPQKVIIPGAHYEGSKLIPGEVEITVEAGEAGDAYNIGPSTFSLPGLAGTPRYTAFYAKSSSSMTGGAAAQVKKVTAQDLANAEEILTTQALEKCRAALLSSVSSQDYVLVQDAVKTTVEEKAASAKAGDHIDNFNFQIKARAQTIVFKRSDVSAFAKDYILNHLVSGQKLDESSLAVSFSTKEVDLANQKIFLDVSISAKTYGDVDETAIKEVVKNKDASQIISSLRSFPEIIKSQARLWPFWANVAPQEPAAIVVKIRLD